MAIISTFALQAASAQEMNFPIPLGKKEKAFVSNMMGPAMRAMFNGERSGMMAIGLAMNPMFAEGFKKEMDITDEQMQQLQGAFLKRFEGDDELKNEFKASFERFNKKLEEDGDAVFTEEEAAGLEAVLGVIFDGMNEAAYETFSEDQMQKMNEMLFVMMGGLEASFLWDSSLDVLNLSDEQKTKLAELKTEMAPEKKKFLDEVERLMKKAIGDGKINLKDFEKFGEEFKETSEKFKQQVMEILTEEQRAKTASLMAKPPKFLARLANILPDWMPGVNSWKPGDGAPTEKKERRRRKAFPQNEEKTE